jgi:MFS family permease
MTVAVPALTRSAAVRIFLAFAFAYFFSALLRAVTATLAPEFARDLGLRASDLGLLAGAYFAGFAALQLPLGTALDRRGPKRVLLVLLVVAVLGCAAFAMADSLGGLILARALIGVGVAACLMAPLTCYRARFDPVTQLRANSWMLMTGSFGMVASTLPVQWLLPLWGWRALFWVIAGMLLVAMLAIAWLVPADDLPAAESSASAPGYGSIIRHPMFVRSAPIGFVVYGGMVAIQALWAGPWLTQVAGWSASEAAGGPVRHQPQHAGRLWQLGHRDAAPGGAASACIGWTWRSALLAGLLLAFIAAAGSSRWAPALGAVVRGLHLHLPLASLRWAQPLPPNMRAGAVRLQPGDLWGRVQRAVGHRAAVDAWHGRAAGPNLDAFRLTLRSSAPLLSAWPTSGSCWHAGARCRIIASDSSNAMARS